jgi:BCD family chlorophyll transporter-like MFS transporter
MITTWLALGSRFMPFADAATPDLPLGRLLRLSLFQVSVGMALVLLVGTLNRVMIVELDVPASLVGIMISLPLIFAPFRTLIGFRSDTHTSVLGWRRVPFIWKGTLVQFGGLAIMPFALLVLSRTGNAATAPIWIGQASAAIAFLLVGAGLHTTQTVGLALATDLASTESQPQVVGLMYVMLLVGMIVSALTFGAMLADFTPFRLVQVIQGCAVATIVLNLVALWKQETRDPARTRPSGTQPGFRAAWESFLIGGHATRRLLAVGLGTMAFSMEDVLLEPYGGQILHLTVGSTTSLTATLAGGGLLGLARLRLGVPSPQPRRRSVSHGKLWRPGRHSGVHAGDPGVADARAGVVRRRHLADRIWRRAVWSRHLDGDDEPCPQKPDRPGTGCLGCGPGLGRRCCGGCRWHYS